MAPAELYFGRGTTDIGYNRSLKDHPELYDSDVDVLKIVYPAEEVRKLSVPGSMPSCVQYCRKAPLIQSAPIILE